jgi:hypothetical protein
VPDPASEDEEETRPRLLPHDPEDEPEDASDRPDDQFAA